MQVLLITQHVAYTGRTNHQNSEVYNDNIHIMASK